MLAIPTVTHAQACAGRGIGGLVGRATVADVAYVRYQEAVGAASVEGGASGTDVGAAYWANPGGFIAYSVAYARRLMPGTDSDVARLGLIAELPWRAILPPGGGICLTAGVSASWYDPADPADERRAISVPLGVAAGFVVPAGPTTRFYPYVHPRLVLTDHRGGEGGRPSDPAVRLGVESGLGFARGPLVGRARAGAALRPVGSARPPQPDLRVGVELGMRF